VKRYGKRFALSLFDYLEKTNEELREGLALLTRQRIVESRLSSATARVALVGSGTQGQYLVRAMTNHLKGWSLTAIHDLRIENTESLCAKYAPDAEMFDESPAFFEAANQCDLLIIATTAPSHSILAAQALTRGINRILLENPVANKLADADRLIDQAERANALVYVNHSRRWAHAARGVQRLIQGGVIGSVKAFHITWGPGAFAMIGTHLFDLARMLTNQEIVRVRAERDNDILPSHRGDQFIDYSGRCEAELSKNTRLFIDLSSDLGMRHRHFLLIGEKGRLEFDENLKFLRLIGSSGRAWETALPYDVDLAAATTLSELREGKTPACSLSDGRSALEAIIGCELSAREGGQWVTLPISDAAREESFPYA